MYAVAIVRYRKALEEVLRHVEEHRAYLRDLKAKGIMLVSGPLDPRFGGLAVFRLPEGSSDAALLAIRDADPYVRTGVAQWELWGWEPNIGKEDVDRL